MQSTKVKIKRC